MKEAFKAYKATLIKKVADDHCGDMRVHKYHMYKRLCEDVVRWCDCVGTPDLTPPVVVHINFDDWYKALDGNTRMALCGSRTAHGPHGHMRWASFETPYAVRCGGVPAFPGTAGTHEERFRALLAEWGIEPCTDPGEADQDEHKVNLVSGYGNIGGYSGFLAVFNFNEDGSFKDMGVWE